MENLERRRLLQWLGAGAGLWWARPALACGDFLARAESAAESRPETEIYRFSLGDWPAYVIHDGTLAVPALQPFFLPEAEPKELEKLLSEQFLSPKNWVLSLNVLVFQTPQGVVLVDSGMGVGVTPTTGRLKRGLEVLGIAPDQVKAVVLSHAHPDHIGGILTPQGQAAFPKARIYLAGPEFEFWNADQPDLSTTTLPDAIKKNGVEVAHKAFQAVGDDLQKVEGDEEFWPGFRFVAAPGHTPGHRGVHIRSGQEELLYLGDSVHVHAAQFLHPDWTMAADTDRRQAVASRVRLLERAVARRLLIAGAHLPFPGLGHVRKLGEQQFAYLPRPWVG